jgi:predicted DNA-binding transcriptional regulator AlpA
MINTDKYLRHVGSGKDFGRSLIEAMARVHEESIYRVSTGRDHCPALSISNEMPETGCGGVIDGPDVSASDDDGGDSDGEPARRTRKEPTTKTMKSGAKQRHPFNSTTSDDAGNKMTKTNSGKHRAATATDGTLPTPQNPDIALWRLPTVLAHIPVSRSGWWAGVKSGRYPQPVKLSARCVAWRSQDIAALIASF